MHQENQFRFTYSKSEKFQKTIIEGDDSMLLSNKLNSSGLTTRTIEAGFVARRVENFQTMSQFVLHA